MGLETRRNGNLYYYKKRRDGDRVVSEYVGKGEVIEIAGRLAQIERERKQEEREALQSMSITPLNAAIDSFSRQIDPLTEGYLTALGYHRHKGQWRRSRF